ncbi:MAG: integrase, partial [Pseudohongiella nitratireducens]|nr:integrase [Pseudohongiella nitratireducens]
APLTAEQICLAMGWSFKNSISAKHKAFHENRMYMIDIREKHGHVTLRHLNAHIHSTLPRGWPWKNKERGIKYSDALYCMRKHELHGTRGVSPVLLWVPGKSQFTNELTARKGLTWSSVWDRNGYTNPDGSRISMSSHQVRHYLNTIAQRGEMGQLDIAKWSGRANIHQNNTYNHMGEFEVLDKVKKTGLLAEMQGPLEKVHSKAPVTLEDLNEIGEGIAHVTEFGFCVHDYSMVPCQKHRDCLNCTEQVCVKGDTEKLERLKRQRDLTALQLIKSQDAESESIYGANRWTAHQRRTLERTDQLIAILESKDVEDGAVIKLRNDQEHSPLKREIAARTSAAKLEDGKSTKSPDMERLRALMGNHLG